MELAPESLYGCYRPVGYAASGAFSRNITIRFSSRTFAWWRGSTSLGATCRRRALLIDVGASRPDPLRVMRTHRITTGRSPRAAGRFTFGDRAVRGPFGQTPGDPGPRRTDRFYETSAKSRQVSADICCPSSWLVVLLRATAGWSLRGKKSKINGHGDRLTPYLLWRILSPRPLPVLTRRNAISADGSGADFKFGQSTKSLRAFSSGGSGRAIYAIFVIRRARPRPRRSGHVLAILSFPTIDGGARETLKEYSV